MEKVFWTFSMLVALSFSGYMTSRYINRYIAFDIRTEIRFHKPSAITLPTIVLCLESTFLENINRYESKSPSCTGHCRNQVKNSLVRYQISGKIVIARDLGQNCHVINEDGALRIAGKIESVTARFEMLDNNHSNDSVVIYFTTAEEFKANKEPHFISQYGHGTRLEYIGKAWKIMLDKTKITRLPKPYISNCTNIHAGNNRFSTMYSRFSCQERCLFNTMYEQCGDVPNIFKKYLFQPVRAFNNKTHTTRQDCLKRIVSSALSGHLPRCVCPLPCDETLTEVARMDMIKIPTPNNSWKVIFCNANDEVTHIREVPDYPLEEFLGALGGILGLALGPSMLSIIELLVYFAFTLLSKL